MLGIDLNVIAHQLNIDPKHRFVKQKQKAFNSECYKVIKVEVDKLLKANFIKNIDYPTWLSKEVLVMKANGQW